MIIKTVKIVAPVLLATSLMLFSCKGEEKGSVSKSALSNERDSLAYVIGMNIADNVMAMDSTINVGVLCRAIAERAQSRELISMEDAKSYYLRYLTYVEPERKRGYEEQFLEDLAKTNRDFTRSNSGLTYNIEVIGDESLTPRSSSDLISLRYNIKRVDDEQIFSSFESGDTVVIALRDLTKGLQESVKMIGVGGKLNAWMPSELAYGEAGDEELEVAPFETLNYDIELVGLERNGASSTSNSKKSW